MMKCYEQIDLREYRDIIQEAIRECRRLDQEEADKYGCPKWGWHLAQLSRYRILIHWGYLSYIEEPDDLEIKVWDSGDPDLGEVVELMCPDGVKIQLWIGDDMYADCKTVAEALPALILKGRQHCENVY